MVKVSKIGSAPAGGFSRSYLFRYTDDISVVLTVNTGSLADPAELDAESFASSRAATWAAGSGCCSNNRRSDRLRHATARS